MLFAIASTIYVATAARSNLSADVVTANLASWRIGTTGTPWLDDIRLPGLDGHPLEHIWILEADNGHRVVGRSPGVVAFAVPAYFIAQPGSMTSAPAAITAALLTATSLLLVFLALRHRLGMRDALLTAVLLGLTTPVWSVAANGMWPHTLTVLGIAGMAWAASRDRWLLVGLFGGIALWGRLHSVVIVALLGVLLSITRREWRIAALAGLSSGLMLALSSVWCRWMYGDWRPTAAYDTGMFADYATDNRLDPVNHLGFWVSPDRGIFVWTPILLVLAPALVRSWRDLPDWSRHLLVAGLGYTILQGTLSRFSGGDLFYGYRHGLEFLACATPAFALSARRMGTRARSVFGPVAILQFAMIAPGAFVNGFYVRADEVWTENAFINVLTTPPAQVLVVMALLMAYLFQRIWANPTIERRPKPASRAHTEKARKR